MPFGRYQGLELDELPTSYLAWLLSLDDLREPLRGAAWSEYQRRGDGQEGRAAVVDMDKVKRVYRTLAMEFHPDRQGGDDGIMKGINLFYEALHDRR